MLTPLLLVIYICVCVGWLVRQVFRCDVYECAFKLILFASLLGGGAHITLIIVIKIHGDGNWELVHFCQKYYPFFYHYLQK